MILFVAIYSDTKEAADRCLAAIRRGELDDEIRLQNQAVNTIQADFVGFEQIVDLTEDTEEVFNVPKAIVIDDDESDEEVAAPSIDLQFDSLAGQQYGFWIEVSFLSRTFFSFNPQSNMSHLFRRSTTDVIICPER